MTERALIANMVETDPSSQTGGLVPTQQDLSVVGNSVYRGNPSSSCPSQSAALPPDYRQLARDLHMYTQNGHDYDAITRKHFGLGPEDDIRPPITLPGSVTGSHFVEDDRSTAPRTDASSRLELQSVPNSHFLRTIVNDSSSVPAHSTPSQLLGNLKVVIPNSALINESGHAFDVSVILDLSQQDVNTTWKNGKSEWRLNVSRPVHTCSTENNQVQEPATAKVDASDALSKCWGLLQEYFGDRAVPEALGKYHKGLLTMVKVSKAITSRVVDDQQLYKAIDSQDRIHDLTAQRWKRPFKESF